MIKTLGTAVVVALLTSPSTQTPTLPPAEQASVDRQLGDRQLDPNLQVTSLTMTGAPIKDILDVVSVASGLSIRYDQIVPELQKTLSVNFARVRVSDVLETVLRVQGLAYKVVSPKSIFVYSNTTANQQKFAEFVRTFYLTKADPTVLVFALADIFRARTDGIQPTFVGSRSRAISVRATSDKMADIEKFIAANDKD